MASKFTQKAQNALNNALTTASEMGHTYIGSEHILLGLLKDSECIAAKMLNARGADSALISAAVAEISGIGSHSIISPNDMTPRAKHIIETSAFDSIQYSQSYIGTEHLLLAILKDKQCVAYKILEHLGVNTGDLQEDIIVFLTASISYTKGRSVTAQNSMNSKSEKSGIPNAPTLSKYGRNLTGAAKNGSIDPIIGRESETERVIQILSRRTKNNPCLIGEPGVGKTAVIEGLAQRIADGLICDSLKNKQIITLDIPGMLAGAKYRGEFEERLKTIMTEVSENSDIILFIDEIHTIIGAGAAEGAIDAANIIKPALARGEMQLIGATTITEYRRHIEKDAALERRFQSVMVGEPSIDESIQILYGLRDKYEAHHGLKISDKAIEAAVNLSVRYIADRYLPDKAIDLIDEASSKLRISAYTSPPELVGIEAKIAEAAGNKEEAISSQNFEQAAHYRDEEKKLRESYDKIRSSWDKGKHSGTLTVTEEDIADVVTLWTRIPTSKLLQAESEKLLHLENELRQRIIGQDEAVIAVSDAIRRGRTGLRNPDCPIGSFIFLGPTGVGKTELSRALCSLMFGSVNAMIRFDMSEYMEKHSISKLIGSPPGYIGYEEGGQLTEKVRRNPYCVILLDEIEKAHPDVFNLLLQVLDDGILTDSQGRRVSFKNTIIIMTSNLGAPSAFVTHSVGFSVIDEKKSAEAANKNMLDALKKAFKPEFINRIDNIIIFNRLNEADIRKIAILMLGEVSARIKKLGIEIEFDDSVISLVSERGFDTTYGARPLKRAILKLIEDSFSTEILKGNIKATDAIIARAIDNKIVYEQQVSPQPNKV